MKRTMRYLLSRSVLYFVIIVLTAYAAFSQKARSENVETGPIHQLRIYEIFERNKAAFHTRFRDHAARIMAKYDFKIVAMWESRTDKRTEFVYLLEWPDEQTMKDCWAKFMGDKEWADIKKETGARDGTMVGEIRDRTLRLTDYSPRRTLLNKR